MDPNVALAELRRHLAEARRAVTLAEANYARELACDRMEALDEWMAKGGFLPDAWTVKRPGWPVVDHGAASVQRAGGR